MFVSIAAMNMYSVSLYVYIPGTKKPEAICTNVHVMQVPPCLLMSNNHNDNPANKIGGYNVGTTCMSVCLSVCLFVCLSVCLSVHVSCKPSSS